MNRSEAGRLGGLKAKQNLVKKYESNPKICKNCELKLSYKKRNNKFCSHSCSACFNNRGSKKNLKIKDCQHCGKKTKNEKFCSSMCCKQKKYETYIARWLAGTESGVWCQGMSVHSYIKKWLVTERGEKCEECGWCKLNTHTGKIPVQLHHVDGNSLNNKPENLKLLCPSCHSLTHNYGSRNKGNGRKNRYASIV